MTSRCSGKQIDTSVGVRKLKENLLTYFHSASVATQLIERRSFLFGEVTVEAARYYSTLPFVARDHRLTLSLRNTCSNSRIGVRALWHGLESRRRRDSSFNSDEGLSLRDVVTVDRSIHDERW